MTSAPLARVLIVDDEAANMRALCQTLHDHGYDTEGFTAGEDALGALRLKPFDVLLTDLIMPGMGGVELLAEVQKIDPHVVGILMTGKGTIETAVQAMQAGAQDYVLKPLKLGALLPVLSRAVVVRRLRLENLELRDTIAIHELNEAIAHTLDANVLLDKVADATLAQFGADEVSVMLLAEDQKSLYVAAVRGERRDTLLGTRVPLGEGMAGRVATRREPQIVQGEVRDVDMAPLYPRPGIQTAVSMPMIARNKLVGVLNVNFTSQAKTISSGQIKVLSIFVNAAAAGIEAARLFEAEVTTRARYGEVLRMAADGILSINESQHIVLFNGGAERMFGYDAEEVLGKPLAVLLPQEMAEAHHRHVEAFGRSPDHSRMMQAQREHLVGRRKDGTLFHIEVGISKHSEGSENLYTAVVRDITQRMEQEARIARLNDELIQAQKMETLGRLAGGVAHDFNNLLTVILAGCELAEAELPPSSSVGSRLTDIASAGKRAADLTQQLLAFSRRQVATPRVLDVNAHVRALEGLLRRMIPGIDIAFALNEVPWRVCMDPSQLDQVVLNLAVNARDAMPDGGTLRIETVNATPDAHDCATHAGLIPGDYVLLRVQDSGLGMDAETVRHAFEPFFTTKAEGKGTGIGLASVHGIVTQNQGSVYLDSEPGRGTLVMVYLPRVSREATTPAAVPALTVPAGHETVLLVDDESTVRQIARRVLERLGYRVLEAADAAGAIALCSTHDGEIHLLLTDITMPIMDGMALSEQVRALRPGIGTLFMSGYAPGQEAGRQLGGEGFHHIQKPFDIVSMAAAVQRALNARSSK